MRRSCKSGKKEKRADNEQIIRRLESFFEAMMKNSSSIGDGWKNMTLGKELFSFVKDLPDVLPVGCGKRVKKAFLLENMLEMMPEKDTSRFCLSVREYIQSLNRRNRRNQRAIKELRDYLNPDLSVSAYCKKYDLDLFDPVERTEKWEAYIEEVERICAEQLKDSPKGLGFCHEYWSVMKDVLREYGIEWKTPSEMNPKVIYD